MNELQLLSTGPPIELKFYLKEDPLILKISSFDFPSDLPVNVTTS